MFCCVCLLHMIMTSASNPFDPQLVRQAGAPSRLARPWSSTASTRSACTRSWQPWSTRLVPLQAPRTLTSCKSTTWCAQACAHMQTCTQAAPWQMHMIRCSNRKRYIPASHKSFFFGVRMTTSNLCSKPGLFSLGSCASFPWCYRNHGCLCLCAFLFPLMLRPNYL